MEELEMIIVLNHTLKGISGSVTDSYIEIYII